MNSQHKAIRALLCTMAHKRAIAYIQSFELPEEEERFLIQCDVYDKSYQQVIEQFNTSKSAIRDKRRRAYAKIADAIRQ